MKKLIITIETSAKIDKETLFEFSNIAVNSITEALKDYWSGAVVQATKIEVDDVE